MNLDELLDRATDGIEPPALAAGALAAANRQRARRRVVVASAAAAVVIIGAGSLVTARVGDDPPGPTRNPTPTVPAPPSAFDPDAQTIWDPATLEQAPIRGSMLPERLEPPALPPSVADQPMAAAILAWPEEGEDVRLLGIDGQWRCIPGTDDVAGSGWWDSNPALSSDGTRLAMASEDGVLVVDVTTGDERVIPWADPLRGPWDSAPHVRWLPGDTRLAVFYESGNWTVDLAGKWREARFGQTYRIGYGSTVAIDPAGPIIEHRWRTGELVEWRGDEVTRRVAFPQQGERFVSGFGLVAYTTGSLGRYPRGGPVVADAETGELLAYAPIRDRQAYYSDNGHLTALGFLDEHTVLLLVGPRDPAATATPSETWHLAAWDFRNGAFERLASGPEGMWRIDVAVGVLADE